MDGLPIEYRPFQTSIRTRSRFDSVSLDELHALLICEESSIEETKVLTPTPEPTTALVAAHGCLGRGGFNCGGSGGSGHGDHDRGGVEALVVVDLAMEPLAVEAIIPPVSLPHLTAHLSNLQSHWLPCHRLPSQDGLCILM